MTMRIGELAERAGTTTRALRYYESRGLLSAQRDRHGHRVYTEDDLRLLQQIRTLQDFGFELEETRPFAECLRARATPPGTRVRTPATSTAASSPSWTRSSPNCSRSAPRCVPGWPRPMPSRAVTRADA
jgi:DNA-binding transcriptional MerR regulator